MCVYICSLFLFLFLLLLDVEFLAIILAILIVKLSVAADDDAASCVFVICEKVYVFFVWFSFCWGKRFLFWGERPRRRHAFLFGSQKLSLLRYKRVQ